MQGVSLLARTMRVRARGGARRVDHREVCALRSEPMANVRKIEVVRRELPERKPEFDSYGTHIGYSKLKLADGQKFWPVILIDGEPSDPDVATSMLARGLAEF